jgi:hypothetical protein
MTDTSSNTFSSPKIEKNQIKFPNKKRHLNRFKSCKSSISSDSNDNILSTQNNSINSFFDTKHKSNFDIEYPVFIRSHSVKKLNMNSSLIDRIKEELNEDDSFFSNFSGRKKFNLKEIMPKDNLLFFEKRKFTDEPLNLTSKMETVPERIDDNFFFESPRITLLSDLKEDSKINKINPNPNLNVIKTPINENDIIKEENEDYFDTHYNFKGDIINKKFESFIDKEEPPFVLQNLQGDCKTFYDFDVITEDNNEEDVHIDAKDIIRKNSFNLRKLGNKVCTDEIDNQPKIRTIRNKIECENEHISTEEDDDKRNCDNNDNDENNDNNENKTNN